MVRTTFDRASQQCGHHARCGEVSSYLHCSHLAKAGSKLSYKQVGLLERGEVAAAIQPVPINQIRIALLGPAARRAEKLFREDAAAHRNSNRFIVAFVEAFPI